MTVEFHLCFLGGLDSSVSIVTSLRAGRPRNFGSVSGIFQTGVEAQLTSHRWLLFPLG
jgi:hypothetical protein